MGALCAAVTDKIRESSHLTAFLVMKPHNNDVQNGSLFRVCHGLIYITLLKDDTITKYHHFLDKIVKILTSRHKSGSGSGCNCYGLKLKLKYKSLEYKFKEIMYWI